ncbi:MAG: MerR family DNA-binding transcriptional regulator [Akkermansiaceae bacterium]|nr:MerR family DNA-binding transcriptional regulator [Armatimonadota bacterium]
MSTNRDEQYGFSIAQVAERTGLSAHTLRYYEKSGLIAPRREGSGGYRRYSRGRYRLGRRTDQSA